MSRPNSYPGTLKFKKVRKRLSSIENAPTDGVRIQAQFGAKFEALITSVGPEGWLDWMLDLRNMLVHRGRRLELGQFVPKTPTLYGPDAQPVLRARRVTHLPKDPGRSDVEVFLDALQSLVLTEDATQTLGGLLTSTKSLINKAAEYLIEVWSWRRDNPRSLRQPAAQWPKGRATQSVEFSGYAPGTFELSPTMWMVHPVVARRFRSAALDDAARPQWATFD